MDFRNYSKESIKARMLERVAALWDIRHVDNLDPVVRLLVEALASEIFKLSGEVAGIEARILEKLARAFTPSHKLSAFPAHAVVHARPRGGSPVLDKRSEFIYKDASLMKKHNLRRLLFSPTAAVRLTDADVSCMIADGKFYGIHPEKGREHQGNALGRDPVFNNTVWLGIAGRLPENLRGLSFFVDFPFSGDGTHYYDTLTRTHWSVGGRELAMKPGIPDLQGGERSIRDKFDEMAMLDAEVNEKYDNRFLHISGDTSALPREPFPAELKQFFDPSFTGVFTEELLWIKIVYPPVIGSRILSGGSITMNCVPVSNKYTRSVIREVSPEGAIIPLEKEDHEYFLAVDSVTDSDNKKYRRIADSGETGDPATGTYTIRRGGCERFNSIDAKEYLIHLLDLLRDESVAFSGMNKDMLEKNANTLLDQLNVLENKLNLRQDNRENTSYIILDYHEEERMNISARYFLTNGETGNGIRVGETMANGETLLAEVPTVSLMTVTKGGREAPNVSRQMDMYKYMLQSHDAIYTRDDIAAWCKSLFGDYFSSVEIGHGYAAGDGPGRGIIRTTDVILTGARPSGGPAREELAREITDGLRAKSPDEMNYRVIFR